jgi:hypothetical protein
MTASEWLLTVAIVLAPLVVHMCAAVFGSAEDLETWASDEGGAA